MARSNASNGRRSGIATQRTTSSAAKLFGAAMLVSALIVGRNFCLRADEIRTSELTVKTPGLVQVEPPIRQATPPSSLPQLGNVSNSTSTASGDLTFRSGPVVRMAQPLAPEQRGRSVIWQSTQEPIPPGGTEYTRGTGVPPIGSLTINTLPAAGKMPETFDRIETMEAQLGTHDYRREWLNYSYFWEAPAFVHQPLYFQEVNLERYGYNWGVLQPFVSGAWFYVKIPLLPYMMTVHPPCECVYTLGYYRPGSCVPYQINWPEVRLDAAMVEATFITGLCFLIP